MNNQMHSESALGAGAGTRPATSGPSTAAVNYQSGVARYRGSAQASKLLTRLFLRYPGKVNVRLWNGTVLRVGAGADTEDPPFTLVFRSPETVWSAVLGRDPLALADAYF